VKKKSVRHKSVFAPAGASDGVLLSLTLAVLVLGWVILYSASALVAEAKFGDQYYFLKKQILWSAIGLAGMLAASRIKLSFVQGLARPALAGVAVLLVLVLAVGHEVLGAKRWLRVGPVGLQPSEFAKLAVVLFLADALDRKRSRLTDFARGYVPLLLTTGFLLGLILLERDLGTPFLIACVAGAMIFLAGARTSHLAATVLLCVPALAAAVLAVPYRRQRLLAFLDPWKDAQGGGYQLVQSLLALGSGGFWGKGSGESTIKMLYLPEAQTDFIFPIFGEEFGFVGTAALTALFFLMVHRCFRAARGATHWFHFLVAAGVGTWLGVQVVFNLAVVTGLLPTKGIPLPLISFGGSSMIVLLTALGLVLNVTRSRGTPVLGGRGEFT
jgi:cell division protein FtsW